MTRLYAGMLWCVLLSAEIIDRIDMIAGRDVITELQLEEELRVTAFLNQTAIVTDRSTRREAASRLIQQTLIRHEMDLSRYPEPSQENVHQALERLRALYSSPKEFDEALARYRLTTDILERHLQLQIGMVEFIGLRFRPELGISEEDLRREFAREIASWQTEHPQIPVPSFEDDRSVLRSTLIEKRTDEALGQWLEEVKTETHIVYLDKSLEPERP